MLIIRLQRVGKKHQTSYRLVVAERRSKLGAQPVEDLGSYHPLTKKGVFARERIMYWMGKGAVPSPTAHNLLVREKVVPTKRVLVKINKPKEKPAQAGA